MKSSSFFVRLLTVLLRSVSLHLIVILFGSLAFLILLREYRLTTSEIHRLTYETTKTVDSDTIRMMIEPIVPGLARAVCSFPKNGCFQPIVSVAGEKHRCSSFQNIETDLQLQIWFAIEHMDGRILLTLFAEYVTDSGEALVTPVFDSRRLARFDGEMNFLIQAESGTLAVEHNPEDNELLLLDCGKDGSIKIQFDRCDSSSESHSPSIE